MAAQKALTDLKLQVRVVDGTSASGKDKIKSLGFNPNAWSPQDIIDLYRFCVNRGHSDPDQITRSDVQDYLNNGQ